MTGCLSTQNTVAHSLFMTKPHVFSITLTDSFLVWKNKVSVFGFSLRNVFSSELFMANKFAQNISKYIY